MDEAHDRQIVPSWFPDERFTAGRENLDPLHVAQYDTKEDSGAPAEVELLVRHGLDERSVVVDLGAGTGQFVLHAAPKCARIIAVDVSEVMLGQLRTKVAASGCRNVELVNAGFLSYVHVGQPADLVYSRWALHHLPDFWKVIALTRIRRHLRLGGILRLSDIVFSFDPDGATEHLDRWRDRLPDTAPNHGDWVRADLEEHLRDEHSTFSWLLEQMVERAGFRIEQSDFSDDGMFASYLAIAI